MKNLNLTPMSWVQEKMEIRERNERARAYSREVALRRQRKANKVAEIKYYIGCFFAATSMFVMLFVMYIVGAMFV